MRNDLKTLHVLDEIIKRPTVFENLFLGNPSDVDSVKVINSFWLSMVEDCATKDYLMQYINDCSKQGDINHFYIQIPKSILVKHRV